jgi:hypothetical protein
VNQEINHGTGKLLFDPFPHSNEQAAQLRRRKYRVGKVNNHKFIA